MTNFSNVVNNIGKKYNLFKIITLKKKFRVLQNRFKILKISDFTF